MLLRQEWAEQRVGRTAHALTPDTSTRVLLHMIELSTILRVLPVLVCTTSISKQWINIRYHVSTGVQPQRMLRLYHRFGTVPLQQVLYRSGTAQTQDGGMKFRLDVQ